MKEIDIGGVGTVHPKRIRCHFFERVSNRVAHGVFSKEGSKLHAVVAYDPTETNVIMEEYGDFLTQLEKTCNSHRRTPLLVLGNFNVTIGSRENELVPKHIGKWLPSEDSSEHDSLLVKFFVKKDL